MAASRRRSLAAGYRRLPAGESVVAADTPIAAPRNFSRPAVVKLVQGRPGRPQRRQNANRGGARLTPARVGYARTAHRLPSHFQHEEAFR
jgi:hypothetical protein